MFTNALVQSYLSIHYAASIYGNLLTYDVTDGVNYEISYLTPDTLYQCTGQAAKFSMFDPNTMGNDTEKTIEQLQVSGPKTTEWANHENPGAVCSEQPMDFIMKDNNGVNKVTELSANFSAVDISVSTLPEFHTIQLNADMTGFYRKLTVAGETNCTVMANEAHLIFAALADKSWHLKYNNSLFFAPEKHFNCDKIGDDNYAAYMDMFCEYLPLTVTRTQLTVDTRAARQAKMLNEFTSISENFKAKIDTYSKLAGKGILRPGKVVTLMEDAKRVAHKECEEKMASFTKYETEAGLKHLPLPGCISYE